MQNCLSTSIFSKNSGLMALLISSLRQRSGREFGEGRAWWSCAEAHRKPEEVFNRYLDQLPRGSVLLPFRVGDFGVSSLDFEEVLSSILNTLKTVYAYKQTGRVALDGPKGRISMVALDQQGLEHIRKAVLRALRSQNGLYLPFPVDQEQYHLLKSRHSLLVLPVTEPFDIWLDYSNRRSGGKGFNVEAFVHGPQQLLQRLDWGRRAGPSAQWITIRGVDCIPAACQIHALLENPPSPTSGYSLYSLSCEALQLILLDIVQQKSHLLELEAAYKVQMFLAPIRGTSRRLLGGKIDIESKLSDVSGTDRLALRTLCSTTREARALRKRIWMDMPGFVAPPSRREGTEDHIGVRSPWALWLTAVDGGAVPPSFYIALHHCLLGLPDRFRVKLAVPWDPDLLSRASAWRVREALESSNVEGFIGVDVSKSSVLVEDQINLYTPNPQRLTSTLAAIMNDMHMVFSKKDGYGEPVPEATKALLASKHVRACVTFVFHEAPQCPRLTVAFGGKHESAFWSTLHFSTLALPQVDPYSLQYYELQHAYPRWDAAMAAAEASISDGDDGLCFSLDPGQLHSGVDSRLDRFPSHVYCVALHVDPQAVLNKLWQKLEEHSEKQVALVAFASAGDTGMAKRLVAQVEKQLVNQGPAVSVKDVYLLVVPHDEVIDYIQPLLKSRDFRQRIVVEGTKLDKGGRLLSEQVARGGGGGGSAAPNILDQVVAQGCECLEIAFDPFKITVSANLPLHSIQDKAFDVMIVGQRRESGRPYSTSTVDVVFDESPQTVAKKLRVPQVEELGEDLPRFEEALYRTVVGIAAGRLDGDVRTLFIPLKVRPGEAFASTVRDVVTQLTKALSVPGVKPLHVHLDFASSMSIQMKLVQDLLVAKGTSCEVIAGKKSLYDLCAYLPYEAGSGEATGVMQKEVRSISTYLTRVMSAPAPSEQPAYWPDSALLDHTQVTLNLLSHQNSQSEASIVNYLKFTLADADMNAEIERVEVVQVRPPLSPNRMPSLLTPFLIVSPVVEAIHPRHPATHARAAVLLVWLNAGGPIPGGAERFCRRLGKLFEAPHRPWLRL